MKLGTVLIHEIRNYTNASKYLKNRTLKLLVDIADTSGITLDKSWGQILNKYLL